MRNRSRRFLLFSVLIAVPSLAVSQNTVASSSVEEILGKWRNAIHAKKSPHSQLAMLALNSNQDGISGAVEEWITRSGAYRRTTKREYDDTELVVSPEFAKLCDWNGFVRDMQGRELGRLRTEIFEKSVTVFGPPAQMPNTTVSQSSDKKLFVLQTTPPDGVSMTWFLDARTFLPVKSVRPGDDSEITATYADWLPTDGIVTPHRAIVSETDKPDYQWTQVSLQFEKHSSPSMFKAPKTGRTDASLEPSAPPIPFNFESNHIIFKIRMNGRPSWFLLDTGADENVISTPYLAEFSLKPYGKTITTGGGGSAEYGYAAGATFTLPGVELRDQHVGVLDQSGLEQALGIPIGGILGYDFISRFVVEIDYKQKLLSLHDPKTWNYSGSGYVVPVTFDEGIPFADAVISVATKPGISGYFALDFGAADTMTLTSPFVKKNDLLHLALTNATVNRPAGLENQFFSQNNVRGHIDQLVLGKLTAKSIPVSMSVNAKGAYASQHFSGTIGESIYRRYHVFLDYARSRIIFEPTDEAQLPFPERKTYGLTLIASGSDLHTFTVTAVRPGSQAEKDGFKKADVISGLNGKSSTEFTLGELREQLLHEGARYEVEVNRSNDQITIPIQVILMSIDKA